MGFLDFFKKKEDNKTNEKTVGPDSTAKVKMTTYNKSEDHISFSLAGTNFCDNDELDRIDSLEYGEELLCILDPLNPYDPNAIVVKTTDHIKIGYVPKDIISELKKTDGSLKKIRCVFTKKSDHSKPFVTVYVKFL